MVACNQISSIIPLWMEQIGGSYEGDQKVKDVITEISLNKWGPQEYYFVQGLLQYKGKWVIGANGDLRT